jgi:hypothetical protein
VIEINASDASAADKSYRAIVEVLKIYENGEEICFFHGNLNEYDC